MTLLLTRPEAAARGFAAQLRDHGVAARIILSPLIRIETLPKPSLEGIRGVLFTSQNAVAAMGAGSLPVWCVGRATAEAARAKGWQAVCADGDADSLFQRVLADAPTGPLLHLRGEHARGNLAKRLSNAGIPTREAVVYRQTAQDLTDEAKAALDGRSPVLVPVFSPRSGQLLADQAPFCAPVYVAAISAAAAETVAGIGCQKLVQAAKPDAESMIAALNHLLDTF